MKRLAWLVLAILAVIGMIGCDSEADKAVLLVRNLSSKPIHVVLDNDKTKDIPENEEWRVSYDSEKTVHIAYQGQHVLPAATDMEVVKGEVTNLIIDASAGSITINNNGPASLYGVYIATSTAMDWGTNLLSEEMLPATQMTMTYPAGEYKIKMVDKYGAMIFSYNNLLSLDHNLVISFIDKHRKY